MYALGDGPVGDVVTAILQVDSRLRVIHRKMAAEPDAAAEPEQVDLPVARTVEEARDLLDGYCTVVYVIVRWAVEAHRDAGEPAADALAAIVRMLFARLTLLKKAVPRPAVPTMIALVTAAAMEASPQRWRDQYGHVWSEGDVAALEATAVCLAEWVNSLRADQDAALRLIMDAYERSESSGDDAPTRLAPTRLAEPGLAGAPLRRPDGL